MQGPEGPSEDEGPGTATGQPQPQPQPQTQQAAPNSSQTQGPDPHANNLKAGDMACFAAKLDAKKAEEAAAQHKVQDGAAVRIQSARRRQAAQAEAAERRQAQSVAAEARAQQIAQDILSKREAEEADKRKKSSWFSFGGKKKAK